MKKRVMIVVFTVLVTVGFVAPISLVHLLTRPTVELNEQVFLKRAVLYAAGLEVPKSPTELVALFDRRVEQMPGPDGKSLYYLVKDPAGQPAGYVVLQSGPGLWGEITAAVGFDAHLEKLSGVDFLKQVETPGLGARIAEPWFREQFRGKRGPFTTVAEGEPAGENQFDAITGATLTSNFVKDLLNGAIGRVRDLVE
jgi:Na+-transporting NADH:ubiquinone oxidoreductase subunit C